MLERLSMGKHHVGRESMHNVSEVRPPPTVSSYNKHWAYSTGQVPSHYSVGPNQNCAFSLHPPGDFSLMVPVCSLGI